MLRLHRQVNIGYPDDQPKRIVAVVNAMRWEWALAGGGTSNLRIRAMAFAETERITPWAPNTVLHFEMREDRR